MKSRERDARELARKLRRGKPPRDLIAVDQRLFLSLASARMRPCIYFPFLPFSFFSLSFSLPLIRSPLFAAAWSSDRNTVASRVCVHAGRMWLIAINAHVRLNRRTAEFNGINGAAYLASRKHLHSCRAANATSPLSVSLSIIQIEARNATLERREESTGRHRVAVICRYDLRAIAHQAKNDRVRRRGVIIVKSRQRAARKKAAGRVFCRPLCTWPPTVYRWTDGGGSGRGEGSPSFTSPFIVFTAVSGPV